MLKAGSGRCAVSRASHVALRRQHSITEQPLSLEHSSPAGLPLHALSNPSHLVVAPTCHPSHVQSFMWMTFTIKLFIPSEQSPHTFTASPTVSCATEMSPINDSTSPTESWREFIAWDEELVPRFSNNAQDNSFTDSFHLGESIASEQPYLVSAPQSVIDGPISRSYNLSGPPSIIDGHSSFEQAYRAPLSFDTTATSPLLDQENDQYFGSAGTWDSRVFLEARITESPVLDTRYERIPNSVHPSTESFNTTGDTLLNPHVARSSHAFSGLDVMASQAFANVGTWIDPPQIVVPIAENDGSRAEVDPIQIPHTQAVPSSHQSYPYSDTAYSRHERSRAITIPTRGSSYNPYTQQAPWTHRVPSSLSVSPVSQRRPRGTSLSRSVSQTRRKVTSPSPTEAFGWVAYQPNPLTNKLAPISAEGSQGRTPRGRKKALTAEQRSNAALMRIIGACSNCQRRKEKCDAGTPCRSCLEYYKGDLVKNPCRSRLLSQLSFIFLSDRLGWHPTVRKLDSFMAPGEYDVIPEITYTVPVHFGFGPAMPVPVHALHVSQQDLLIHEHVIYSWPADSSPPMTHRHAVLPAIITPEGTSNLHRLLDSHLSLLVTHYFREFPLYCSDLRILRDVYIYSRSLSPSSPHYRPLHQALKLLVLVHDGGDITLPLRADSSVLSQLINTSLEIPDDFEPTPCFIRSQFGAVMPGLAMDLMNDILTSLEHILLNRGCDEWPAALAILITVLMTVESIHYHATKLPYHYKYRQSSHSSSSSSSSSLSSSSSSIEPEHLSRVMDDDEGVRILLEFYKTCYLGCHARLRPDWEGDATGPMSNNNHHSRHLSPEDIFIESVRKAIKNATAPPAQYLQKKVTETRQKGDMGFFFDRLVARLLLLKS